MKVSIVREAEPQTCDNRGWSRVLTYQAVVGEHRHDGSKLSGSEEEVEEREEESRSTEPAIMCLGVCDRYGREAFFRGTSLRRRSFPRIMNDAVSCGVQALSQSSPARCI